MKYFILMGDIIGSKDKNQQLLMEEFKSLINEINFQNKPNLLSPLTITLGDEFQGVTSSLSKAIDILLNIEETIIFKKINFKLRYVLNEGDIDTPINDERAYEMLGKGLTDARYHLNSLKNSKERFHITLEDQLKDTILVNSFKIFENTIDKWNKEKDYEIASNFIQFKDYKIVSERMNKNRSLLWKRKKTLNLDNYYSSKNIIQAISRT